MIDFYLHEDPEQAAQLIPAAKLDTAIIQMAQLLSAVWSRLGADLIRMDWARVQPTLPELGPWQMITLCQQRIYNGFSHGGGFSGVNWVVQYGGNYNWVYVFALALCDRYRAKSKSNKPHVCEAVIYTLELVPQQLWETMGTFSDYKEPTC